MPAEVIDFLKAGIRLRGLEPMLEMNTRRLDLGWPALTWFEDSGLEVANEPLKPHPLLLPDSR